MVDQKILLFGILSLVSTACFHEDELRKELFNVNTRVLSLEQDLQDKQQMNSRQQVSASGRVSQMQEDLQKIRGEIDRLQVGIQKGEMPGVGENEPSIAKQLNAVSEKLKNVDLAKLEERIMALEKAQIEILNILEKIDKKKGTSTHKKAKLTSFKAVSQAFHKNHFHEIVEDAPHLFSHKDHDKHDREEGNQLHYYYAESLFKTNNVKEAAIAFGELLKKENRGELAPKIRLRLGDCFRRIGDKKTALAYYRQVVEKFPHASESESAKKHIKKLEENPTKI